jgi:ubiquinone/menaquinone biosynthesis C-methylase UbiE
MELATAAEIRDAYRGDKTASGYVRTRFTTPLNRLLHDRQVRAVQRLIRRVRPTSILEIAPGPGRITRDVRPGGTLVCLEYNEGMIAQGRAACGDRATWVRGDAFRLPFGQGFDLVYSFRFVRHFHRADRDRLYAEVRRVLRPGGHFVMDAVSARVARPFRDASPEQYPIYDKLYHPDELRDELARSGLEPVALEPVHKLYRWQYRSQVLLGPRANWLNRLLIRALERIPAREGLEWIVTCRRA